MDSKTKDAIKQLQAEMRQLQTLLQQRPDAREEAAASENGSAPRKEKPDKEKSEAAVHYAVQYRLPSGEDGLKTGPVALTAAQLGRVTDEAAASLGYALSSPQKVALLRALLANGPEAAAALGATTRLSTGSLYHHLRDLMHAGLIGQSGRNCYRLTDRGLRVLLVVLALAAEA